MRSEIGKKVTIKPTKTPIEEGEEEAVSLKAINVSSLKEVLVTFWTGYLEQTPKQIKLMDAFVIYCISLIVIQFLYFFIIGNFPQNSLIIGIFTPLGAATVTLCLRQQINERTRYMNLSRERSFWEYFITMYIMFLACINYLG